MSAELVPEMDTTEALPWVRDMQGLTERIIELIALKFSEMGDAPVSIGCEDGARCGAVKHDPARPGVERSVRGTSTGGGELVSADAHGLA